MNYFKGKKVLVTGGAGFIGSHLVEALVKAQAIVSVLDDFSTGTLLNLKTVESAITLIKGSVSNSEICMEAASRQDSIFHLAALVSVPESTIDPLRCYQINTSGTANILEAARKNSVSEVLFASSSSVYGNQKNSCNELIVPSPESPYGFSKLMGEQLCHQYFQVYGIKTVIVRYFNVYGERQNPQGPYAGVVAKFRDLMAKGEPITIFGDGSQRRDFVNVHDVIKANLQLISLPSSRVGGEAFNIGTGKSSTILELFYQLTQNFNNYKLTPKFEPARLNDVYNSLADCSKYLSILNENDLEENCTQNPDKP